MTSQERVIADTAREVVARARAQTAQPQTVDNVTRMARAMDTTIFVNNASSLGFGGPGYLSHSIATPTGKGITTPLTFRRERQMTICNALRII